MKAKPRQFQPLNSVFLSNRAVAPQSRRVTYLISGQETYRLRKTGAKTGCFSQKDIEVSSNSKKLLSLKGLPSNTRNVCVTSNSSINDFKAQRLCY